MVKAAKGPKPKAKKGMKKAGAGGPKSLYGELLTQGQQYQTEAVADGYQTYVEESLREGETIDLNTREYRYIGYFTSLRKAIELAWNYPLSAARRGMSGRVNLLFTVEKDGGVSRVKVLDSSGFLVLDNAIVDAIQTAAPFSPLPEGFNKKYLDIRGTFNYLLH